MSDEPMTYEEYREVLRKRHPTWDVGEQCPECGHGALVRIPAKAPDASMSRWLCTSYGQCELSCG